MYQGIRQANVLLDGTVGAQFEDQLQPLPQEPVVVKKRVAATFGTELPLLLKSYKASAVVRFCYKKFRIKSHFPYDRKQVSENMFPQNPLLRPDSMHEIRSFIPTQFPKPFP
jgi:hypothetical protein